MPPRPRGERGGASGRRKKRREERILFFETFLTGLYWFAFEADWESEAATTSEHRPSQSRPSVESSEPRPSSARHRPSAKGGKGGQTSASSSSEPIVVESDEEEPQLTNVSVEVKAESVWRLVPNTANLSEGISVHPIDSCPGFERFVWSKGYVLLNNSVCSDLDNLTAGLHGAIAFDLWQTLVIPRDWVKSGCTSRPSYYNDSCLTTNTLGLLCELAERFVPVIAVTFIGRNNLEQYKRDLLRSVVPHIVSCVILVTDKEDKARIGEALNCRLFLDDNRKVVQHLRRYNLPHVQVGYSLQVGDEEVVARVLQTVDSQAKGSGKRGLSVALRRTS